MALTKEDIASLSRDFAPVIREYVEGVVKPLADRLAALEAHGVKYCGVYQKAQSYRRGEVTTHDSAMWVALRNTGEGEAPGKAPDAWQLAEKIRKRVPAIRGAER